MTNIEHLQKIVNTYLVDEEKHYEENPTEDHVYHSLLSLDKGLKSYEDEMSSLRKLKDSISDFRKDKI